jgi:hypothetical protein
MLGSLDGGARPREGTMNVARRVGVIQIVSAALLLCCAAAWAARSGKSDAVGGDATCTVSPDGRGFCARCTLRDTKADGNYVRLEWSGPGKSGKDDLRRGAGSTEKYTHCFDSRGDFRFKAVVDRGLIPDSRGRNITLRL